MGRHAGAQIVQLHRQAATEPFTYHDKGMMATIGRRSAVVQLARDFGCAAPSPGCPGWPCTCSTCSAGATGCPR